MVGQVGCDRKVMRLQNATHGTADLTKFTFYLAERWGYFESGNRCCENATEYSFQAEVGNFCRSEYVEYAG